jgi:CMP-N,N'-diacetyllegionaminic acid synthase
LGAPRLLIVVPARGGSKGLPRKNIRLLAGKPLIAWTADAIRNARLENAVAVLSTDDEEIAETGRRCGLDVPFIRPAELATDEASAESVALHALDWAKRHAGVPEAVMLLQPTSPFRPPQAIVEADALLRTHRDSDGVMGVRSIHRTLRTLFRMDAAGRLEALAGDEALRARRQEIEPLYTPNGAMYVVRTAALEGGKGFFPLGCRAMVMDAVASLDVDDEKDWRIAEAVAERD